MVLFNRVTIFVVCCVELILELQDMYIISSIMYAEPWKSYILDDIGQVFHFYEILVLNQFYEHKIFFSNRFDEP